ncbi:hypothetical protein [Thermodesulfitimonas autotrophica]|uniref:hypothetical protein n=1 Tax=Thermodesulfitimonas autotrophica TaxID=1894989 RepID=UPI002FE426C1
MRRVCLEVLGGIPVVGPLFHDYEAARRAALRWLVRLAQFSGGDGDAVQVGVERREDLYTLVIAVNGRILHRLEGLNEVLLRRLQREFRRRRVFVVTSFADGQKPRPLVWTEGLGLVIFQWPLARKFT